MDIFNSPEQLKAFQLQKLAGCYMHLYSMLQNGLLDRDGETLLNKIKAALVKPAPIILPTPFAALRPRYSAPTRLFDLDSEVSSPSLFNEAQLLRQNTYLPRPTTAPTIKALDISALKSLEEELLRVQKLPPEQRQKIVVAALLSQQGSTPAPNLRNVFTPPVALLHQWQVLPPPWGAFPISPFHVPLLGIQTMQLQTMLHALGKQPLQSKSSSEPLLVNGPAGGAAARTSALKLVPDDNTSETHTINAQNDRDMETLQGAEAILCLRNSSPSSDIPTRARSHRPRKTQAMLKPVARRPGQGKRNAEGPVDAPIPKRARSAQGPH
eukprot:jgi/Botrbrau1/21278/Bobra.39_2s0067.1